MCDTCWDEAGQPTDWNPRVAEVVKMIDELYELNAVGGPLHAELDDWNVDHPVITPWEPWFDGDEDPEMRPLADRLAAAMTALSMNERYSALAHHEGWAQDGRKVVTA